MGQVFDRMIAPRLPDSVTTISRAETALTLAMLEYALSDIGVAWLPLSLVRDHVARGRLSLLDELLPVQALDVTMLRLSEEGSERGQNVWQHLIDRLRVPADLERVPDGAPGPVQPFERAEE